MFGFGIFFPFPKLVNINVFIDNRYNQAAANLLLSRDLSNSVESFIYI